MGFDENWEKLHQQRSWGKYPSTFLIKNVAERYFHLTDRSKIKALDLGCGGGANSWFLAREGFDVYAIDGSKSAIHQAERLLRKDGLTAKFFVMDFSEMNFFPAQFDIVIDNSAIQHNIWSEIQKIHEKILSILKEGGLLYSQMISKNSTGSESGECLERNTWTNLREGIAKGNLLTHFFTQDEILILFGGYSDVEVEKYYYTYEYGRCNAEHFIVNAIK